MRGEMYDNETMERAYALFELTDNNSAIGRKLGIPTATVRGWRKKYLERLETDEEFAKVRHLKKERLVRDAWKGVELSMKAMLRRLERAVQEEAEIDLLISVAKEAATEEGLDPLKREALVNRLKALKCEDLGKLGTVFGTLYDKQALASGDATENASVSITPFEGL